MRAKAGMAMRLRTSVAFAVRRLRFVQMLVDDLGHLKHVELLGAKHPFQRRVSDNFALVRGILEVMALNVLPDPLCNFGAR